MPYANNILDLLITIGYNIKSVSAYRSTGMELRFFYRLRFNAITGSSSALHFVAHSSLLHSSNLYYTIMWKYDIESSSNGWLVRPNQLLCRDIKVSKG